jgi:hypothetical protein
MEHVVNQNLKKKKVLALQTLDAKDSSTFCIMFQQPFNTVVYPTFTSVFRCRI